MKPKRIIALCLSCCLVFMSGCQRDGEIAAVEETGSIETSVQKDNKENSAQKDGVEVPVQEDGVHLNGVTLDDGGKTVGYGLDLSYEDALEKLKTERADLRDIGSIDYELITHIMNSIPLTGAEDKNYYKKASTTNFGYTLCYTNDPEGTNLQTCAEIVCYDSLCEPDNGYYNTIFSFWPKVKHSIAVNEVVIQAASFTDDYTSILEAVLTHLYGAKNAKTVMKLYDADVGTELSFELDGKTFKCRSEDTRTSSSSVMGGSANTWTIWCNLIPVVDATDVTLKSIRAALDNSDPLLSSGTLGFSDEQLNVLSELSYHKDNDGVTLDVAKNEDDDGISITVDSSLFLRTHKEIQRYFCFKKAKAVDSYAYYAAVYSTEQPGILDIDGAEKVLARGDFVNEGATFSLGLNWINTGAGETTDIAVSGAVRAGYLCEMPGADSRIDSDGRAWGIVKEEQKQLLSEAVFGESVLTKSVNEFRSDEALSRIVPIVNEPQCEVDGQNVLYTVDEYQMPFYTDNNSSTPSARCYIYQNIRFIGRQNYDQDPRPKDPQKLCASQTLWELGAS